jgi:hypothetical protein
MHIVVVDSQPAIAVGPFETDDDAESWAKTRLGQRGFTWVVEYVHKPEVWDMLSG